MNNKKIIYLITALVALILISACSAKSNNGLSDPENAIPAESNQGNTAGQNGAAANSPDNTAAQDGNAANSPDNAASNEGAAANSPNNAAADGSAADSDKEILIIIDQTPKPIEGNSFDFVVNKLPEGYSLSQIQWVSEKNQITNTIAEAIEHGQNGEDGFYISGDGQFSGFFYPDTMKGEEGEVSFLFKDDQGQELTWKKKITLN
ncbi:hypothetical protein K0U00_14465 [Paenibacillus sepulcri]|uniref:DUF4352 domain-containing protein n=2 Tax=Paenibacillus sepulcri TaxID=359917 RepID=A0ABS7C2V1_9BACL|nr:hypothetical protein [Paenibacillus sepulcri]